MNGSRIKLYTGVENQKHSTPCLLSKCFASIYFYIQFLQYCTVRGYKRNEAFPRQRTLHQTILFMDRVFKTTGRRILWLDFWVEALGSLSLLTSIELLGLLLLHPLRCSDSLPFHLFSCHQNCNGQLNAEEIFSFPCRSPEDFIKISHLDGISSIINMISSTSGRIFPSNN